MSRRQMKVLASVKTTVKALSRRQKKTLPLFKTEKGTRVSQENRKGDSVASVKKTDSMYFH